MSSYIRIQYASGLARALKESRGRYCDLIHPVAPYLALCGNIVNPHNRKVATPFFNWAAENFEVVWWVPGHEEVATPLPGMKNQTCYSVTENLKGMYDFINTGPYSNIHIANKLSRSYEESRFKIIGVSRPSVHVDNIYDVFHGTGESYTYDELVKINALDHSWIEKELAVHNLANNHIHESAQKEPTVILTTGYVQTSIPYNANILGDLKRNLTGVDTVRDKKLWFGVNNWETHGYISDKFIEIS